MNKNKKIGILTHYYDSLNYGGNLQAYALVTFLCNNGYDAEQICYNFLSPSNNIVKRSFYSIIRDIIKNILFAFKIRKYNSIIDKRREKFFEFNKKIIKNGNKEYNDSNISLTNDLYDIFIVGSDQVWNPMMYCEAFYLKFVKDNKKKISYAASVAKSNLSNEQLNELKNNISHFDAISVREESTKKQLKSILDNEIYDVVDPTLLLSFEEWDKICSDRVIEGDYILYYFLGTNIKSRKLAKEFAKKKHIKLIGISSIYYRFCDEKYSDEYIVPSPEEFLSLIKYAKYVFTDSFHAIIFSYIYKKQFFVFKREENDSMSSRIINILDLLDLEKRYCFNNDRENISFLESLSDIDNIDNSKIESLIKHSKEFIIENID